MNGNKENKLLFLSLDTFGWIGVSAFFICAVSGVFLAIPYDVEDPYLSVSHFLIFNPAAVFARNLHYWSAQLFLIFTILHIWDHYKQKTEDLVPNGVWLRLVLSVLVVFFVMLSGFILKGDADSIQARRILSSLIKSIPVAGDLLEYTFLGQEGSYLLLYVHHIATATIILVIIIIEHARSIWPKLTTFLITSFITILMSFFFQAPLHDGFSTVFKGPWYFVGFQEILHWLSRPAYAWLIILLLLLFLYLIKYLQVAGRKWAGRILLISSLVYLLLTLTGYFLRGENWAWQWPWQAGYQVHTPFIPEAISFNDPLNYMDEAEIPTVMGRGESCLVCHQKLIGFTPAHDPVAVGCASCHGGNPFTMNKAASHRAMVRIPGNLEDAMRSCGTSKCHPQIPERINRSLMTSMSGIVSVDRFVFHESASLSSLVSIQEIGHTAADRHLRDMCGHCHLGNPKTEPGSISQLSRGGGCNACHLNYSHAADSALKTYLQLHRKTEQDYLIHPQLSVNVTDDHCFGCHSRSGRISLNYEGWHETLLDNLPDNDTVQYRMLDDKRIFRYINDDVHHAAGMSCIDCHHSYELMGDGYLHYHKEEQVDIFCTDCHLVATPNFVTVGSLDPESRKIAELRGYDLESRRFLKTRKSGIALINTFLDEQDQGWLMTKENGNTLPLRPPIKACQEGNSHNDLSCTACHTSWAPQCIGCHNSFDKDMDGYDLLEGKPVRGSWVEYVGQYLAGPPTLGVMAKISGEDSLKRVINTFIPGMILSIDKASYTGDEDNSTDIFHRLFAPAEPHTTVREGRSCKSCHNDPVALGYGRGKLVYEIGEKSGKWKFYPKYALNEHDDLPEDAWTGFLKERTGTAATRENMRPFNRSEQISILTVGSCLVCHEENSDVMERALSDWGATFQEVSDSCVLPDWGQ